MTSEPPVIISRAGPIGVMELNRPRALNALNLEMVLAIRQALTQWSDDDDVAAVLITGVGERAFCAGGDVKSLALAVHAGQSGPGTLPHDFLKAEYATNLTIAEFPKPYVSLLDGITMGGGVGVSLHGDFCVATNHTRWAMPETGIGFFTDVGASYFLSRLGPLGTLLGLTGEVLSAGECVLTGVATHFAKQTSPEDILERMQTAISKSLSTESRLSELKACLPQDQPLPESANRVQKLTRLAEASCTAGSIEEVSRELHFISNDPSDELNELARDCFSTLTKRCPFSLAVVLELLRRGGKLNLAEALEMEFQLSQNIIARDDFYEGIRAVLIDKDQSPKWSPANIESIAHDAVSRAFSAFSDESQSTL
ncbi:MAG: enoyl-CoA hydratase/isomerase family protein [Aureliella sp.]